jgi:hypothetical protein
MIRIPPKPLPKVPAADVCHETPVRTARLLMAAFCISILGSMPSAKAAWNQIARESARIEVPLPAEKDGFGIALASNATHWALGAPGFRDARDLESFGSVHIFERQNGGIPAWVRTLDGPRDSSDRRFGVSLAMGADFLAIAGANHFHKTNNPRAVIDIHVRDHPAPAEWGRATRIELGSSHLESADQILSLASDGERIFAGFPAMESVLVIERTHQAGPTWHASATLKAPDAALFDNFGTAVAIHDGWLAASAPFEDDAGKDKGAIYLFQRESASWAFARKILPPASSSGSWLGRRLSLHGEWLAALDSAGDILLFRRDHDGTWPFAQKIAGVYDYDDMHLKDGELLCGSAAASAGSTSSGRGELFALDPASGTWRKTAEFRSARPQSYGLIGGGVRIDEQGYLLGSGFLSTTIGGTIPRGTCHMFARPALDDYEAWTERVLPSSLVGTQQADRQAVLNSLGVNNQLCHVMGLDPFSPNPARLPRMEFDPADQRWGIRFQVRPNLSDFSWRVAQSTDMSTWSSFSGTLAGLDYSDGAQLQYRKLPTGTASPRFFRLEIQPLEP